MHLVLSVAANEASAIWAIVICVFARIHAVWQAEAWTAAEKYKRFPLFNYF